MHHLSHVLCISGSKSIKQGTVMLNKKNETMHLLQVHNNVCIQDRAANFMFFALTPLITSFNAKDVNADTSWMSCHFCCISANFWICGTCSTLLKISLQYMSLTMLPMDFEPASLSKNTDVCGESTCRLMLPSKPLFSVINFSFTRE